MNLPRPARLASLLPKGKKGNSEEIRAVVSIRSCRTSSLWSQDGDGASRCFSTSFGGVNPPGQL